MAGGSLPRQLKRQSGFLSAHFTVELSGAVAGHAEGMGEMWDRIEAALATIPGLFGEGGSAHLMEPGDLIEDSPLDRYLKETNDG